ncbi:MAG: FCD domain-containing protein [Mesorhizobium sp.]|uniref:GntR family transcriptional regulator n=1 Tax=unclassified Mesorhizobium TaxID=325217 RepID=UPI000F760421|nr:MULTISPECIES: GntR family transcriptional regulator [unclassified Mesorhizobium]RVC74485.1 FCD domain-containing protein [Mesorhizobium sp. M2A.F.Ca.ET.046.02.1.1]AZO33594.1 GntR family transcriptional regulator [Mesorhizobium sp. M2A.F.Ca.ET.046.03.2.1]RWB38754.1 MAG: FCD domain-containing protein [Mesorhizobium sp.]RWE22206.1 MAG: FCD domain-containing protein [Mesorhizobium sp.]RWE38306.1 MAG: FCD domain-containing protein [Mesorhizobium sp.]
MPLKPSSTSRTAETYRNLRDAIVQARLLPGERLKIDDLSAAFEASSGAVREALSRLTAEGLVKAEPQKGFEVAPISRKDLIQLTEVRITVEGLCLQEAIRYGTVEWEARVLSTRHQLNALAKARLHPETDQGKKWPVLHMEFHDALVSACRNEVWLEIRQALYIRSERYRRMSGPVEGSGRSVEQEHNAIADAALARDAKAAKAAMKRHLEITTEVLLNSSIPFQEAESDEADLRRAELALVRP